MEQNSSEIAAHVLEDNTTVSSIASADFSDIWSASKPLNKYKNYSMQIYIKHKGTQKIDKAITYIIQTSHNAPSRKNLTDNYSKYVFGNPNKKLELQKVNFFVVYSRRVDIAISNKSYVLLTAHYICDWKLRSTSLNCKYVEEGHMGQNMVEI